MSNKLEFSLGLFTGGFLSELGHAGAGIKGFIGSMVSLGAITSGVMHAIETGASLESLRKRTGESVENLVKLQSGFKAAGLSAEDVAPALFLMEKSLGGVNEFGQGTAATFNRLGLSIGKLKAMNAPQAMAAILGSLKQLNQADATKAASVIFGRGEAGNMLQLARSSGEFAEGMAKAASKAKLFSENARSFEMLERTTKSIKGSMDFMFAGIAAGIAPALLTVEKKLASIDLGAFGKSIGEEITRAFEAIDLGQFGKYFELTLKSAAFDVGNFVGAEIQKALDNGKPKGKTGASIDDGFFKKYGRALLAGEQLSLAVPGLLGGLIGIPGNQEAGDKWVEKAYSNWQKSFSPLAKMADSAADVGDALMRGLLGDVKNPYSDELAAMRAGLLSSGKSKLPKDTTTNTSGENSLKSPDYAYKPDFTMVEKMGFVMSGIGNPDWSRRTADATERSAELLETIAQSMGGDVVRDLA